MHIGMVAIFCNYKQISEHHRAYSSCIFFTWRIVFNSEIIVHLAHIFKVLIVFAKLPSSWNTNKLRTSYLQPHSLQTGFIMHFCQSSGTFMDHTKKASISCHAILGHFSCLQLFETQWTSGSRLAPLSMGFSRQEYWSGLPCFPLGISPTGIELLSLALQTDSLLLNYQEANSWNLLVFRAAFSSSEFLSGSAPCPSLYICFLCALVSFSHCYFCTFS